jgi:uncharacterized membrane protein
MRAGFDCATLEPILPAPLAAPSTLQESSIGYSPFFPYRPQLVLISGGMELAGAIGLFLPFFSRTASNCLSIVMVTIFPANVYAANQSVEGIQTPSVPLCLAMQVIYILLLLTPRWGFPRLSRASRPQEIE